MGPHLIWKVPLELGDAPEPVGGRLLTEQLNVEEGALPRAKQVPRSAPTDDARRHVGDDVLRRGSRDGVGWGA